MLRRLINKRTFQVPGDAVTQSYPSRTQPICGLGTKRTHLCWLHEKILDLCRPVKLGTPATFYKFPDNFLRLGFMRHHSQTGSRITIPSVSSSRQPHGQRKLRAKVSPLHIGKTLSASSRKLMLERSSSNDITNKSRGLTETRLRLPDEPKKGNLMSNPMSSVLRLYMYCDISNIVPTGTWDGLVPHIRLPGNITHGGFSLVPGALLVNVIGNKQLGQLDSLLQYQVPIGYWDAPTFDRTIEPNNLRRFNRSTSQSITPTRSKSDDPKKQISDVRKRSEIIIGTAGACLFSDASSFECDLCGRYFKTPNSLSGHKSQKHPASLTLRNQHSCTVCGRKFSYRSHLRRHLNKHDLSQSRQCNLCGKQFRNLESLVLHKKEPHGLEKSSPFQCHICQRQFIFHSFLQHHMRSHCTGEHHQCSGRYRHQEVRDHPTESGRAAPLNYVCELCQLCFLYPSQLKRHSVVHTKEHPFVCELCGRRYTQSGALRAHQRNHHPAELRDAADAVESVREEDDTEDK
ncbi:KRAB domain-containing zinc finger protein [Clonorchis sinensis]|uniref:KRAB domain-containing zinc finger protein n=1 Tax=Clonorchis sinensis TaxID=79923 RepID=G7Y4C3_CLOSI|nr:KRAB domain-containing zinc finger protein [Clonorchis sinensis]